MIWKRLSRTDFPVALSVRGEGIRELGGTRMGLYCAFGTFGFVRTGQALYWVEQVWAIWAIAAATRSMASTMLASATPRSIRRP